MSRPTGRPGERDLDERDRRRAGRRHHDQPAGRRCPHRHARHLGGTPTPTITSYSANFNPGGTGRTTVAGNGTLSYTIQASDVGKLIDFQVTATNSAGFASSGYQTGSAVIDAAPAAPAVISGPTVSLGSAFVGNPGAWSGNPTPTFTYQWQACTGMDGTGCTVIAGQTSLTLAENLVPSIGSVIFTVTASNGVGDPVSASYTINYA